MDPQELEKAIKTCFAISNVNRRIQMLYGEGYGVSIRSAPGEGTRVSIRLGQTVESSEKGVTDHVHEEREA